MEEDDTPIDELMFELEVGICERFVALSPLSMRRERVYDVFRLISQYSNYAQKESKNMSTITCLICTKEKTHFFERRAV